MIAFPEQALGLHRWGLPAALKGSGITSFPDVYWREIDLLARYFTGVSYSADLTVATLPFWTITSSDLRSDASSVAFANVVSYKAQFEKPWGLG